MVCAQAFAYRFRLINFFAPIKYRRLLYTAYINITCTTAHCRNLCFNQSISIYRYDSDVHTNMYMYVYRRGYGWSMTGIIRTFQHLTKAVSIIHIYKCSIWALCIWWSCLCVPYMDEYTSNCMYIYNTPTTTTFMYTYILII